MVGDKLNSTVEFNVTAYDRVFVLGNALLKGMEIDDISKNSTDCFNAWLYFYFRELPVMEIKYHYGDTDDNIFNTSRLIGNMTKKLSTCAYMIEGFYDFVED